MCFLESNCILSPYPRFQCTNHSLPSCKSWINWPIRTGIRGPSQVGRLGQKGCWCGYPMFSEHHEDAVGFVSQREKAEGWGSRIPVVLSTVWEVTLLLLSGEAEIQRAQGLSPNQKRRKSVSHTQEVIAGKADKVPPPSLLHCTPRLSAPCWSRISYQHSTGANISHRFKKSFLLLRPPSHFWFPFSIHPVQSSPTLPHTQCSHKTVQCGFLTFHTVKGYLFLVFITLSLRMAGCLVDMQSTKGKVMDSGWS